MHETIKNIKKLHIKILVYTPYWPRVWNIVAKDAKKKFNLKNIWKTHGSCHRDNPYYVYIPT